MSAERLPRWGVRGPGAPVRGAGEPARRRRRAGDGRELPTPVVNDMGAGKGIDAWDAWTARMRAEHRNGNGHGRSLEVEALRCADGGPWP